MTAPEERGGLEEVEFWVVHLRDSLRRVGHGDYARRRIVADPELRDAVRAAWLLGGADALDLAGREVCPFPLEEDP